jgi:L-gulonate 3-dehydrogenase
VDAGISKGIGMRWAFMGPFETIDLNAPGGIRDYVDRYEGLYRLLAQSQALRVPWSGELLDRIEAERSRRLPRTNLAERQEWRDHRLMALASHIAATDNELGS